MARDRSLPRRATIHDVAAVSGISRGTVSRVLNGEPYVSDHARQAVEAAIREVGYVRNTAARNLVTQRSRAVALIVHEPHSLVLEDPNIGNILIGTNAELSNADYQMVTLILDSARDSERVAEYLRGGFVDGAIILSARVGDPIALAVAELGIPAAFVGHPPNAPDIPYIGIDNTSAARQITTRLLKTGRKRIGMIAAALDRDSGQDRLTGFTAALGERFDPTLVVDFPLYAYDTGAEGMRQLLAREPAIDGVFAASDAVAAGAMDVLRNAGRRVPDDVGIVGFDDSSWAIRCHPALSTVRQPADELGRQAALQVLDQLRGGPRPTGGTLLQTEVVWRDSA
ncbi:LacI family DNA-binding transcriptional regulator [Subtercola boreus]|uniref:LacI family transcriptional regulator n=1 Tax=Subtercola boreus TaxID=120213 RepID=A0A3E0WGW0_9MICO|nr:LacI family DNA-binding transcriptional regulator [Subtercola boreus]RFA23708.1 LacI family transcriptional regulator [Subtercola boreus]RFA24099.1 LacI family transcriptional regulator [Subtercola boreus]RFA29801.1 LacI family transcriptional regulator [Subtercola boreus]